MLNRRFLGTFITKEIDDMRTQLGILTILVAFLAGCSSLAGGSTSQIDEREIANIAACYTEGIDEIGNGRVDSGTSRWKQCFSDDFKFSLSFGTSFSVACPGEKCILPKGMPPIAQRVALAKSTYERSGFVATSHHLTSVRVTRLSEETGSVDAHLQAWHIRKDGAAVLGLGTWHADVRRTPTGWKVTEERLESPLRVVMPKAE